MSRFDLRTRSGQISAIIQGQSASSFDADAEAYFFRVESAGGTLTTTEKNAVNNLVLSLKSNGIWTLMLAIYPMVGASAAACAQNLKSTSYTGTFTSGWTFASNGVTPNGTSAYMNTGLNPVAEGLTSGNSHMAYYARTVATVADRAEMGNFGTGGFLLQSITNSSSNRFFFTFALAATRSVATAPIGLMSGSAIANTRRDLYLNGISVANNISTDTASLGNYNVFIGAANSNNAGIVFPTNSQCAFASIGNGLSSIQMANLYTSVQAFQTSLSRNV